MKNNNLISFIGLVKKAGKLCIGKDATIEAIINGTAELILFSKDLSSRSMGDIYKAIDKKDIPVVLLEISMNDFENMLNKKAGIICIKDSGFAKKIQMLCEI